MGFWHRIPVIADLLTCTVGAVLYVKMARSALLVKQDPLAMVFFGGEFIRGRLLFSRSLIVVRIVQGIENGFE